MDGNEDGEQELKQIHVLKIQQLGLQKALGVENKVQSKDFLTTLGVGWGRGTGGQIWIREYSDNMGEYRD